MTMKIWVLLLKRSIKIYYYYYYYSYSSGASPSTSSCSSASLSSIACSSVSSLNVTAFGAIFTSIEPPLLWINVVIVSIALFNVSIPYCCCDDDNNGGSDDNGDDSGGRIGGDDGDSGGGDDNGDDMVVMMLIVVVMVMMMMMMVPISLSSVILVMTYIGGAINLIFIGASVLPTLSPASNASLIASMPSYVKHVTSILLPNC